MWLFRRSDFPHITLQWHTYRRAFLYFPRKRRCSKRSESEMVIKYNPKREIAHSYFIISLLSPGRAKNSLKTSYQPLQFTFTRGRKPRLEKIRKPLSLPPFGYSFTSHFSSRMFRIARRKSIFGPTFSNSPMTLYANSVRVGNSALVCREKCIIAVQNVAHNSAMGRLGVAQQPRPVTPGESSFLEHSHRSSPTSTHFITNIVDVHERAWGKCVWNGHERCRAPLCRKCCVSRSFCRMRAIGLSWFFFRLDSFMVYSAA